MRLLVSGLLLLFLVAGCSRLQTFRVVDAQSGQPLDGVRAERLEGHLQTSEIPLVLLDAMSPVEAHATDASGSVVFQGPGAKFMVNPSSKNPSYNQAYVTATWSGAKVLYPAEHREISVKARDGVVEIPLLSRILDAPPQAHEAAHRDDPKEDHPVR